MARPTDQLSWLWDLHPLKRGTWGSIQYPVEGIAPGETVRVRRAQGMNGDDYQSVVLFPGQSRPSPYMGTFSRSFYLPTHDELSFLQQRYPDNDHPAGTPWARIEADLVVSGKSPAQLRELNAPTLLSLLRKANRRAKAGRKQDTDPEDDAKVAAAWNTGRYQKYEELGAELGRSARAVRLAVDRHRQRSKRVK